MTVTFGGVGAPAAAILQNRSDGTMSVLGDTVVGPIRFETQRLMPTDDELLAALVRCACPGTQNLAAHAVTRCLLVACSLDTRVRTL